MARNFLLLLGVLPLLAVVSANCDAPTIQKVKACYVPYLAGFNLTLTSAGRLPEYWIFHNARLSWVAQNGSPALTPICSLFHTLQTCLQPYTCLGYTDFENSLGSSTPSDSDLYWQDLSVSNYQCGAGFNIFQSEMSCIGAARDRYPTQLQQCITDFDGNVKTKGYCKSEQTLLNCQSNIFQKACDWNAGVFMCNCILAGFSSMDATCQTTNQVSCPSPRQASALFGHFTYGIL